jgi:hypothetical protein
VIDQWAGRAHAEHAGDRLPIGGHKRPVGAAFFLPRTAADRYVWLPDTLSRIGTVPQADPVDPAQLVVEWGDLDCEAHVLDLDSFTTLVLAFEHRQFLGQLAEAERIANGADAVPLARAFRAACIALGPDVLTADSAALVTEFLPLLYLSESFASGIEPVLTRQPRDELPVPGGRLIFRSAGEHRW